MLTLNIIPILKARGIEKPYSYLVQSGFTPYTATTIVNKDKKAIRLNHIEKLCVLLNCTPNDILQWTPDKKTNPGNQHPLLSLQIIMKTSTGKKPSGIYHWNNLTMLFP